MKKIIAFLSAPYLMGTLFLVLAASMGIATFVENDFGTNAAKALYYDSWWFEGIFVLLGINMFLNLGKPYLWRKGKLPVLFFHMSFFIIIIGAALTRYVGYEGMMHIREGQATNQFRSAKNYIAGTVRMGSDEVAFEQAVLMSEKSADYFKETVRVGGHKMMLKSVSFMKNTSMVPMEDPNGKPLVSMVVSVGGGRNNLMLFKGEHIQVGKYSVGFDVEKECDFNIFLQDEQLYFTTTHPVFITDMGTQEKTEVDLSAPQPFYSNVLYGTGDFFMVQTNYLESAALNAVPVKEGQQGSGMEAVVVRIDMDGLTKEVTLQGRGDLIGEDKVIEIGGAQVTLSYGSKLLTAPFSIRLNDFQLERYPGSESPSSFASEVTLEDSENGVVKHFRIFMNNILNYKGYRFYQSSYDEDELGTVLSVNNDLWGTLVTYLGYFLLTLSMILSLMASQSRFRQLGRRITEITNQKKVLIWVLLVGFSAGMQAQDLDAYINVTQQQAERFGNLWVQDNGGRIKPMNSLNGEILRKLVKHNSYKGYSADRVVLSILTNTEAWKHVPLITIKKGP